MENVGAVKELCKLTVGALLKVVEIYFAESHSERNLKKVGKPTCQLVMDVVELCRSSKKLTDNSSRLKRLYSFDKKKILCWIAFCCCSHRII